MRPYGEGFTRAGLELEMLQPGTQGERLMGKEMSRQHTRIWGGSGLGVLFPFAVIFFSFSVFQCRTVWREIPIYV